MARRPINHLFIGTKTDIASMNIAKHVLQRHQWNVIPTSHITFSNPTPLTAPFPPSIPNHSQLSLNYPNVLFSQLLSNYFFPTSLSPESKSSNSFSGDLKDSNFVDIETERERHRISCNIQSPDDLNIDQLFFVSRHAAASGTVSLTVHPIGIPHLTECGRNGGIAGRCSPPNPHIGNLYRSILQETKQFQLDDMFTITLEATHHGPYVEIPTCFIEIGSSSLQWEDPIAGTVWASCLGKYFAFPRRPKSDYGKIDVFFEHLEEFFNKGKAEDEEEDEEGEEDEEAESTKKDDRKEAEGESSKASAFLEKENEEPSLEELELEDAQIPPYQQLDINKGIALFVIGGGHYVPRMNDMARFGDEYHVGHALASYCLDKTQFQPSSHPQYHPNSTLPEFDYPYQRILHEAIQSMRIAYPDCRIGCLIDKKSFKGEEKDKIIAILDAEKIFYSMKTADIRKYNLTAPN
eukprot:gene8788-9522_t